MALRVFGVTVGGLWDDMGSLWDGLCIWTTFGMTLGVFGVTWGAFRVTERSIWSWCVSFCEV